MKKLLCCLMVTGMFSQQKYEQIVSIKGDTSEQIIEKAANIIPAKRQVAYHEEEFIGFIHFGPNTFSGVEWGNGKEDASIFNPKKVDTDQWCREMKNAGMKKVMITVKHHDGYCTWQTRYNNAFSVKQSAWKNGKGDVLKLLSKSAKKYGLKLGVYMSPADLYQIENKEGLYGNLSKYQESVIPTDPTTFKTNPLKTRAQKGEPTFKVLADDYNRYFMNQLYEVLTEYGTVDEVWFDGAHPKRKGGQKYIKSEWFKMIRTLQPTAVIFGGPDIRWCGNEAGRTRKNEWNVIPIPNLELSGLDRTPQDLGSDKVITQQHFTVYGKKQTPEFLNYMISEVDTSLRHGWFWRNEQQGVKSLDWAYDTYERCRGGNAVFLLNVPPNKEGRFSDRDVTVLRGLGKRIKATYKKSLLPKKTVIKELNDGDVYTSTKLDNNTLEIDLGKEVIFNRFEIQEAIATVGQRVQSHSLFAWIHGAWEQISKEGVIGYKRIHRFKTVTTSKLKLVVDTSRSTPEISEVALYYYEASIPETVMYRDRKSQKIVAGMNHKNFQETKEIRYTLDGSEPIKNSLLYKQPFELDKGGVVKSRIFSNGKKGAVLTKKFGLKSTLFKVSGSQEVAKDRSVASAVDKNEGSFWMTKEHKPEFVIQLKETQAITGFSYQPHAHVKKGIVKEWELLASEDGEKWTSVKKGAFLNIKNNPTERTVVLDKVIDTKYLKFVPISKVDNTRETHIAEFKLFVN